MHTPLAVLFALLTTVSNALATVLQRKAAQRVPVSGGLGRGLMSALVRQRVWLGGMAAVGAAACFQALALANGALSVVQPVFVLELPIALLLAGAILHRRLAADVWRAAAGVTVGLGVALWAAAPTPGDAQAPMGRWLIGLACGLGAAAVLTATAVRRAPGAARAACLALAAALCYALTAALLKSAAQTWQTDGLAAFFSVWQTYGFALVGVVALFLLENALQSGPLTFSQPALTLGDACTSVALGALLFEEKLRGGWWLLPEAAGVALILLGIVLLSRSSAARTLITPAPPEPAPGPGRATPDRGAR
ncbi:DMT family transporter [Kitasatospora sp. NPDC094015]|uniref:DMT family transporter n=1 Tax=Kitasatospora sp. NPDC094015 TaxID=3155205 RepID=UPI003328DD58